MPIHLDSRRIGKYGKSREAYEEAVAIRQKLLGPTHPETVTAMNNLAELLLLNEDTAAEGKAMQEKIVEALEEEENGPSSNQPGGDMG